MLQLDALKALVIEAFGLGEDAIVHSCSQAYLQPAGFCTKGDSDVAFLRKLPGHQLQVCNVWMHVEVNSQVFSLVSMWNVLVICDLHWYATVEQKHDAEFIPTKDLACCSPYMSYEGKKFRVLVPLQIHVSSYWVCQPQKSHAVKIGWGAPWWSLLAKPMHAYHEASHGSSLRSSVNTIHGSCVPKTCASFAACLFTMFLVSHTQNYVVCTWAFPSFESNVGFTSCLEAVALNNGLVCRHVQIDGGQASSMPCQHTCFWKCMHEKLKSV